MITKYADLEVLEVKKTNHRLTKGAQGDKLASFEHLPEDTYRTDDDYMYVKVRAISSRVNKNHDGWPTHELAGMSENKFKELVSSLDEEDKQRRTARVFTARKISTRGNYGFKTFVGRPIFVDHNNSDPERTRGVIVDSLLHIEPSSRKLASDNYWSDPPANHAPETWIELLLEVDAKTFPKLAKAFEAGDIDSVSMGCNVEHTTCSVCGNEAADVEDYCNHIRRKGGVFYSQKHGKQVKAYEDCHGINFFEISAVFDPADETALFTDKPISKKASQGDPLLIQMDDAANYLEAAIASIKVGAYFDAFQEIGQAHVAASNFFTDYPLQFEALNSSTNMMKRNPQIAIANLEDIIGQLRNQNKATRDDAVINQDRSRSIRDKWQVQKPGERLKWTSRTKQSYYLPGFHAIVLDPATMTVKVADDEYDGHSYQARSIGAIYDNVFRGIYNPRTKQLAVLSAPFGGPFNNDGADDPDSPDYAVPFWQKGMEKAGLPVRQYGLRDYRNDKFVPLSIASEPNTPKDFSDRITYDPELAPGAKPWQEDPVFDPKGFERMRRRLVGHWVKKAYYLSGFHAIIMNSMNDKIALAPDDYTGHIPTAANAGFTYAKCFRGVYNPATQELCLLSAPSNVAPEYEDQDDPNFALPFWRKGIEKSSIPVKAYGKMEYNNDSMQYEFAPLTSSSFAPSGAGTQITYDPELAPGAKPWQNDPQFDPKGYHRWKRQLTTSWTKKSYYLPEFNAIIMDGKSLAIALAPDTATGHGTIARKNHFDYLNCFRGIYNPHTKQLCMISAPVGLVYDSPGNDMSNQTSPDFALPYWKKGIEKAGIPVSQYGAYVYGPDGRAMFEPVGQTKDEVRRPGMQVTYDPELAPGAKPWREDPDFDPKGFSRLKKRLTGSWKPR